MRLWPKHNIRIFASVHYLGNYIRCADPNEKLHITAKNGNGTYITNNVEGGFWDEEEDCGNPNDRISIRLLVLKLADKYSCLPQGKCKWIVLSGI